MSNSIDFTHISEKDNPLLLLPIEEKDAIMMRDLLVHLLFMDKEYAEPAVINCILTNELKNTIITVKDNLNQALSPIGNIL